MAIIPAGNPSVADAEELDLNQHLVKNPESTYGVRVRGEMHELGITAGDLLIVDRSLPPDASSIVVVSEGGRLVVKRYTSRLRLVSRAPEERGAVWGVVTFVIRDFN